MLFDAFFGWLLKYGAMINDFVEDLEEIMRKYGKFYQIWDYFSKIKVLSAQFHQKIQLSDYKSKYLVDLSTFWLGNEIANC
jgi:hypothetical protein